MQCGFSLRAPLGDGAADLPQPSRRAADGAGSPRSGYTDHPAPSAKWLAAGGHATLDPFAALCSSPQITTRCG